MATDSTDRRRFVWDLIDTHWPELWDQPAPLKATDSLVTTIRDAVLTAYPTPSSKSKDPRTRASARRQTGDMVRRWLDDPAKWSPVVDDIAVERALAFDWDAINNLTDMERAVMVDALAQMDDPWSERDNQDGIEEVARMLFPGVFNSRSGRGTGSRPSHRRLRFLSGDPVQRLSLNRAMNKRRKQVAA